MIETGIARAVHVRTSAEIVVLAGRVEAREDGIMSVEMKFGMASRSSTQNCRSCALQLYRNRTMIHPTKAGGWRRLGQRLAIATSGCEHCVGKIVRGCSSEFEK